MKDSYEPQDVFRLRLNEVPDSSPQTQETVIQMGGLNGVASIYALNNALSSALQGVYGGRDVDSFYNRKGGKEELIRRIKELPLAEKVLYGIDIEGTRPNE